MSDHIHKRHNKNLLLYHIVCPIKYRKVVLTKEREETLKETCAAIAQCYEIHFV
ncbi:MAG: transposase, partial [Candidatus Moranbacteria bacterium]|nr:transposase [Candidatus Moranbacteria bacterium]